MALTLLGGVARGLRLEVPNTDNVRPTSVMLRRKLFDSHQHLDDHIFIDLCAGTGSVGLEAWSREAAEVYLIELDGRTHKYLCSNIKKVSDGFSREFDERPIISRKDKATNWLNSFKKTYESWSFERQSNTILFFDPPYEKKALYDEVISLNLREWYYGRIWVESDRQKGLSADHWQIWGDQFVKTYFLGTSYVAVLDLRQSIG